MNRTVEYVKIKTDSFGLYDENGICRTWFSSNYSREYNMSKLNYEEYCCRISSNTLEYAKNRINSWYKKKDTVQRQTKNKKSVPMYMMIGYL